MANSPFDLELMREDMTAKGWLQTDVAKRCKVTSQTISNFFKGGSRSARTAGKIAKALGHPLRRYMLLRKKVAA